MQIIWREKKVLDDLVDHVLVLVCPLLVFSSFFFSCTSTVNKFVKIILSDDGLVDISYSLLIIIKKLIIKRWILKERKRDFLFFLKINNCQFFNGGQ